MTDWITPLRAALLAAALAALAYLGALANGFAYDDLVLIAGDPGIRQLEGLGSRLLEPSWPDAFGASVGGWRPVTTATWALVWAAAGESTLAFHALGVALHALATALGVLVLVEIVPVTLAALVGLIFAVHPVHVEAVANVVGSAEPLAAVFAMTAVLLHLRGGTSYALGRVLLVTTAYSLATLAKEGAAVLPLLIFLLDAARRDIRLASAGAYVRDRFTLFASMATALTLVLLARASILGGVSAASHPPGAEILREAPRVWTVFSTWPHYLRLLFFPAELAADYGPGVIPIAFGWNTSAALGVVVGLLFFGGAWWSWRRGSELSSANNSERIPGLNERIPGLGMLWIAGAMLPVSNVLFLGPVLVAERTFYLASWGACLTVGWLLFSLAEVRGRTAIALAVLVIVGGTVRTVTRVPDWKDTDTIMDALIETRPQSGIGWLALGQRLSNQGRQPEALTAYSYAVTLMNSEYNASTQIATHLMALGRVDSARFFLERAWREHPEWYSAPGLLAAVELNAGRPEQAAPAARAATVLEPGDPSMHHLLAQALSGTGDWSGAAQARRAAIDTGFADRGSTWLQLAGDLLNGADSIGSSLALDSASVRRLNADEVETLAELRSALDARDR